MHARVIRCPLHLIPQLYTYVHTYQLQFMIPAKELKDACIIVLSLHTQGIHILTGLYVGRSTYVGVGQVAAVNNRYTNEFYVALKLI